MHEEDSDGEVCRELPFLLALQTSLFFFVFFCRILSP